MVSQFCLALSRSVSHFSRFVSLLCCLSRSFSLRLFLSRCVPFFLCSASFFLAMSGRLSFLSRSFVFCPSLSRFVLFCVVLSRSLSFGLELSRLVPFFSVPYRSFSNGPVLSKYVSYFLKLYRSSSHCPVLCCCELLFLILSFSFSVSLVPSLYVLLGPCLSPFAVSTFCFIFFVLSHPFFFCLALSCLFCSFSTCVDVSSVVLFCLVSLCFLSRVVPLFLVASRCFSLRLVLSHVFLFFPAFVQFFLVFSLVLSCFVSMVYLFLVQFRYVLSFLVLSPFAALCPTLLNSSLPPCCFSSFYLVCAVLYRFVEFFLGFVTFYLPNSFLCFPFFSVLFHSLTSV